MLKSQRLQRDLFYREDGDQYISNVVRTSLMRGRGRSNSFTSKSDFAAHLETVFESLKEAQREAELQQELAQELVGKNDDLQANAEDTIREIAMKLYHAKEREEALEGELESLRETRASSESMVNSLNNKVAFLKKSLEEEVERADTLSTQLDTVTQEMTVMARQRKEAMTVMSDKEELAARLEAMELELQGAKSVEQQLARAKTRLTQYEHEVASLQHQVSVLKSDESEHIAQIKSLKRAREERDSLAREVQQLRDFKKIAAGELHEKDVLDKEVKQLRRSNETLSEETREVRGLLEDSINTIRLLEESLEEAQTRIQSESTTAAPRAITSSLLDTLIAKKKQTEKKREDAAEAGSSSSDDEDSDDDSDSDDSDDSDESDSDDSDDSDSDDDDGDGPPLVQATPRSWLDEAAEALEEDHARFTEEMEEEHKRREEELKKREEDAERELKAKLAALEEKERERIAQLDREEREKRETLQREEEARRKELEREEEERRARLESEERERRERLATEEAERRKALEAQEAARLEEMEAMEQSQKMQKEEMERMRAEYEHKAEQLRAEEAERLRQLQEEEEKRRAQLEAERVARLASLEHEEEEKRKRLAAEEEERKKQMSEQAKQLQAQRDELQRQEEIRREQEEKLRQEREAFAFEQQQQRAMEEKRKKREIEERAERARREQEERVRREKEEAERAAREAKERAERDEREAGLRAELEAARKAQAEAEERAKTGGYYEEEEEVDLGAPEVTAHHEMERIAFVEYLNFALREDAHLRPLLPLNPSSNDVFAAVRDGVMLCKIVNLIVPGTIDDRVINLKPKTRGRRLENINLGLNSGRAVGCNLSAVTADALAVGRSDAVMEFLWQTIKVLMLSRVTPAQHPELVQMVLEPGEETDVLLSLKPEAILVRWINYHLKSVGGPRTVQNLHADLQDSDTLLRLLHSIAPQQCNLKGLEVQGNALRATMVLDNASQLRCTHFLKPAELVKNNERLSVLFIANLFHMYPGLKEDVKEEVLVELNKELSEHSREELVYRTWMNSLGIRRYVTNLVHDCKDGVAILQVMDVLVPGLVQKRRFKEFPRSMFHKIENCNYVVFLGKKLDLILVNVGGKDLSDGNPKMIMSILSQLMRYQLFNMLSTLNVARKGRKGIQESALVEWANGKVAAAQKASKMKSLKDSSLASGAFWIDLLDAVKPGVVRYDHVSKGATDEERESNAKYIVNVARKIGCTIFMLYHDIVEVNSKMLLTLLGSIMYTSHQLDKKLKEAEGGGDKAAAGSDKAAGGDKGKKHHHHHHHKQKGAEAPQTRIVDVDLMDEKSRLASNKKEKFLEELFGGKRCPTCNQLMLTAPIGSRRSGSVSALASPGRDSKATTTTTNTTTTSPAGKKAAEGAASSPAASAGTAPPTGTARASSARKLTRPGSSVMPVKARRGMSSMRSGRLGGSPRGASLGGGGGGGGGGSDAAAAAAEGGGKKVKKVKKTKKKGRFKASTLARMPNSEFKKAMAEYQQQQAQVQVKRRNK